MQELLQLLGHQASLAKDAGAVKCTAAGEVEPWLCQSASGVIQVADCDL